MFGGAAFAVGWLGVAAAGVAAAATLHVDGSAAGPVETGSAEAPFRTISAAAAEAQPGDIVLVADGEYRERVVPVRSGTAEAPIIFRSARRHGAVVRGSEVWRPDWQPHDDSQTLVFAAWRSSPLGSVDVNPFLIACRDDGSTGPQAPARPGTASPFPLTLGQIFVDGDPLRQVTTLDDLERTPESWMTSPAGDGVLAHFRGAPPVAVEVSVRDRILAPLTRGLAHIRVEGFVFEHCANQFPWPANGAVSTRSGRNWVIRDNVIRHAVTIGLEIGSEGWMTIPVEGEKPGATRIIAASGHLVERNAITDNGLSGIAGWTLARSIVRDNSIERNNRLGFVSSNGVLVWEMAGIKLHNVKDVQVVGNLVRDNESYGIWIDNRYRNSRISRNVVLNNQRAGIFIELGMPQNEFGVADDVLLDHNVVAGTRDGDGIYCHDAPGVTVVHNLLAQNAGFGVRMRTVTNRQSSAGPDQTVLASTSGETIRNNLFSDNASGAISLPVPSARSERIDCDANLFLTTPGSPIATRPMFHVENLHGHRFLEAMSADDTDRLLDRYRGARAETPMVAWPLPEHWENSPWLTFAQWQAVMGWDQASAEGQAPSIIVRSLTPEVEFRGVAEADALSVSPIPGLTADFHGRPYPPAAVVVQPGPFQNFPAYERAVVGLWPVREDR